MFWGVHELFYLHHLEQCLVHSNRYRFAKYDALWPLYTVFRHIYLPIFSFRGLFYPVPSLQFIKQIPGCIVATDVCGGFQVTLHCISYLFFRFIECLYSFSPLVLSWQLHSFYTPNFVFFLKRGGESLQVIKSQRYQSPRRPSRYLFPLFGVPSQLSVRCSLIINGWTFLD